MPNINISSNNGGSVENNIQMSITLPNVKNYEEFVTQLQKDRKFESMIQDMTVNRLAGGSALAKNRHRW